MKLAVKALGELELVRVGEVLVAEDEHRVLVHAGADRLEGRRIARFSQVEARNFGREYRVYLVEPEDHGGLPSAWKTGA